MRQKSKKIPKKVKKVLTNTLVGYNIALSKYPKGVFENQAIPK